MHRYPPSWKQSLDVHDVHITTMSRHKLIFTACEELLIRIEKYFDFFLVLLYIIILEENDVDKRNSTAVNFHEEKENVIIES